MSKRLETSNAMNGAPLASQHVQRLRTAVLSPCSSDCLSTCAEMRSAGVSQNDITDRYIPAVACSLGKKWSADQVTFAATTVAAARLQWLLRLLEPTYSHPEIAADVPGIAVFVPAGEQHTLGAILLGSQLRRRGFFVNLVLEAKANSIKFGIRKGYFQATMISASSGPHLSDLRALVAASRFVMDKDAPVLIGGPIAASNPDLKEVSGADYVSTDVNEALRVCAFDVKRRAVGTV